MFCTSSSPVSRPEPITRFKAPAGRPACSKISMIFMAVSGVNVAGLKTTVFPQTSAGAIFHTGIATGKFRDVDGSLHFAERIFQRLAFFAREQSRQLFFLFLHDPRGVEKDLAAIWG